MPGPGNRKSRAKNKKPKVPQASPLVEVRNIASEEGPSSSKDVPSGTSPIPGHSPETSHVPAPTILHDPGNGPRVMDFARFLASPYADPVSLTDPQVSYCVCVLAHYNATYSITQVRGLGLYRSSPYFELSFAAGNSSGEFPFRTFLAFLRVLLIWTGFCRYSITTKHGPEVEYALHVEDFTD